MSETSEKFVVGVDVSDRYTDSVCVGCGDGGLEEMIDSGDAREKRSFSREVDADAWKLERLTPSLGCEWDRRKFGEK